MATIHHAWQQPAQGPPDTYNLYEGPASGQETLLISLPGTQTTYDRPNAAPGTYYGYVTAVYGGVESAPSNEASVTVVVPAPTLTATPTLINNIPAIILEGS